MNGVDSLLVGFNYSQDDDSSILLVGRKTEGEVPEIINAIQGKEAEELYNKLIGGEAGWMKA